jgi:hypothetical protein
MTHTSEITGRTAQPTGSVLTDRLDRARRRAAWMVSIVAGSCALEAKGLSRSTLDQMVDETIEYLIRPGAV